MSIHAEKIFPAWVRHSIESITILTLLSVRRHRGISLAELQRWLGISLTPSLKNLCLGLAHASFSKWVEILSKLLGERVDFSSTSADTDDDTEKLLRKIQKLDFSGDFDEHHRTYPPGTRGGTGSAPDLELDLSPAEEKALWNYHWLRLRKIFEKPKPFPLNVCLLRNAPGHHGGDPEDDLIN